MRPNCKDQVFQMNNSDTSNRLKYVGKSRHFKEHENMGTVIRPFWAWTHPPGTQHCACHMPYLVQAKNFLLRQQNIYHVFSHASKLPLLEACIKSRKMFYTLDQLYWPSHRKQKYM